MSDEIEKAAREFMATRFLNYEDSPQLPPLMADFARQQNAEQSATIEQLRKQVEEAEKVVCGEGIKFGKLPLACERPIDSHKEVFRCYDCGVAFHRECLKRHCNEKKWRKEDGKALC